jgi:glutamate-5-semialdehyde dehydrogenase
MSEVTAKGKAAKKASYQLIGLTTDKKNEALGKIAKQLVIDKDRLIKENQKDLEEGRKKGFSESTLDRIMLNVNRIDDMAAAIRLLIDLKDPIGEKLETIEKENGLLIKKLRVPIGVIGMIYEARPNVTIDAATRGMRSS